MTSLYLRVTSLMSSRTPGPHSLRRPGLGVPLAPIAEGGGQRGGAALIVERGPAVIDG